VVSNDTKGVVRPTNALSARKNPGVRDPHVRANITQAILPVASKAATHSFFPSDRRIVKSLQEIGFI
jgi:hypothetical protein